MKSPVVGVVTNNYYEPGQSVGCAAGKPCRLHSRPDSATAKAVKSGIWPRLDELMWLEGNPRGTRAAIEMLTFNGTID